MHLAYTVTVVLFVCSWSFGSCLGKEHLVPKVEVESKHVLRKRDLTEADTEMILKTLFAKLEHAAGQGQAEQELMALLMKLKELGGSKLMEDEHKKDTYSGSEDKKILSEEAHLADDSDKKEISKKVLSEEVHLAEDSAKKEMSKKMVEEAAFVDPFSDKDVSLAESLYHMKIAGDVESYPHIKMESLYEKKLDEDKLIHEEAKAKASDEAFIKKVDEMDKALKKEEGYPLLKEDDIEGYLKNVAEAEKGLYYDTEVEKKVVLEKTAEEKGLEEWKASHKDIFPVEEEHILDEKLKLEGIHKVDEKIAHQLNDELIKKLKASLGMDKVLDAEHLIKNLHKKEGNVEGSPAYEKAKEQAHKDAHIHLTDEEMKKHFEETAKTSFDAKVGIGMEKSLHDIAAEEALKSKEAHSLDKAYSFDGKAINIEKSHYDIAAEEALKLKEAHSMGKAYGFDAKVNIGVEKSSHGIAAEEALKSKEAHALDKAYGFDTKIGTGIEKSLHDIAAEKSLKSKEAHALDKSYGFKEDKAVHGAESAVFDSKVGIEKSLYGIAGEEALKSKAAHALDEAYGFEKSKNEATAHGLGVEYGIGIDKTLHGIAEEEALNSKEHGLAFGYEKDKKLHTGEAAFGGEVKHAVGHDIHNIFEADKAFKIHEDERLKKDKAYGADVLFHKDKEILDSAADHHIHGVVKDEEVYKFHKGANDKHHVAEKDGTIGAEKSHSIFHELKAKFFELLRKVLHTRKCHLVTLSPGELLSIVNCVSRSKDSSLCEKFATCEKKMPYRVIKALEKCQKELIPEEVKKCSLYAPFYPSTEIPVKIFQCVAINVGELIPEEQKEMIDFEECARVVKAESCGRFNWFRGPY